MFLKKKIKGRTTIDQMILLRKTVNYIKKHLQIIKKNGAGTLCRI